MIRIVLADDHLIFREGLVNLLQKSPAIELLADACDGQEAWTLIEKLRPDVAVLDLAMPGMSGIAVAERIAASMLPTRALILTMHDDPFYASEAERIRVAGYVLKERSFAELIQAITTVAAGGVFRSQKITENLERFRRKKNRILSPRERDVLKLLAMGQTSKEAARQLGISPRTIETHKSHMFTKLEMKTMADLIRYAAQIGLVDADLPHRQHP